MELCNFIGSHIDVSHPLCSIKDSEEYGLVDTEHLSNFIQNSKSLGLFSTFSDSTIEVF